MENQSVDLTIEDTLPNETESVGSETTVERDSFGVGRTGGSSSVGGSSGSSCCGGGP